MAVLEHKLNINAPAGKVMALVNDPKRIREWEPSVLSVDVTPGHGGRIGEVWNLTYSMMGMRSKQKATILEWEDNKRVVWKHEGSFQGTETQLFEPAGERSTRYIHRMDIRFRGLMGLLAPLMMPMMKRRARRIADKFKGICEAEAKQ
jgi:carbon monoxide dehydrogenase subunit G